MDAFDLMLEKEGLQEVWDGEAYLMLSSQFTGNGVCSKVPMLHGWYYLKEECEEQISVTYEYKNDEWKLVERKTEMR